MKFRNLTLGNYQVHFAPGAYKDNDFDIVKSDDRDPEKAVPVGRDNCMFRYYNVVEGEVEIEGKYVPFRSEPMNYSAYYFFGGDVITPGNPYWEAAKADNRRLSLKEGIPQRIWKSPLGTYWALAPDDVLMPARETLAT
ncbi:MAG TPA: hypothetical protein VLE93_01265 [Candidatus Saccharimonadales bacterium]|nr:hypothetical protein [Candidatus Saccharimonadales bacterium]